MDDKIRIRQGDLYQIDADCCRVFVITSDLVGVIGMDRLFIEKYDPADFLTCVRNGTYKKIEELHPAVSVDVSEEEMARIRKIASVMDNIITEQYPAWHRIVQKGCKIKILHEAASELSLSVRHFKLKFYAYLRSGRNMYSLIDKRHMRGVPKPETSLSAAASPLDNMLPEQQVLTKKDSAMLDGLRVFKDKLSVTAAYDYLLREHYSTVSYEVVNGVLEDVVTPDGDAPSYSSFYRYISKHLGGLTIKQFIKGEKDTRNNDRFLTGNQRSGIVAIGQVMQVDECEVAVNLVSDDGTKIIGKPVLYCAFEPVSQIIIGAYVGLINNSMGGFINLFMSMLEPHENQTAPCGVHCDDITFPSMVIPKTIYSDQGSEYMSGHMEAAMLELGIVDSIVPVAAGSYKGGVENCFKRLQSRLKNLLIHDGYILPTHEGPDAARKDACLTLDDFKTIIYRLIIELNTTSLGDKYSPDMDMLENNIPPVPSEIWKHKMKTCFDPISVTDANRMQILFALLWRDKKFDRGRDGFTYHGHNLRFFVNEDWFKELLRASSPEYEIRYSDTDIGCIYIRYKKMIHKVPLATSRDELRSFIGMTWTAYDEAYKQYKALKKEQKKADAQARLTTAHRNEQTLKQAKALHEGVLNDTKSIKDNRALERVKLENDSDELRNRVLDVKPEPVMQPATPTGASDYENHNFARKTTSEILAMLGDEDE